MEHGMGERRKGGSSGNAGRDGTRTSAVRRGTRKTSRSRSSRTSGAQVIPLRESRRTRLRATGVGSGGSSTSNAAWTTGRRRLRMVVVAFAVIGFLLAGRAVQMIVADGDRYQAFASEQGAGSTAPAVGQARGSIVSADGRKLATSLQAARVIATPYQIEEPDGAARALADVLGSGEGLGVEEIEASLTERSSDGRLAGYSVVASGVRPETARKVAGLGIAGISIVPDTVRVYPEKSLASQLVGHVGEYGDAFGGVEASYNEALESGEDVHLTLDTAVQQELEEALEATVKRNEARGAVGLVMRVEDGAIVALANTPGYDNNNFDEAPLEAQRNRVLTDPYEPGSTFKAFTVASALEEGAVTPSSTFLVPDHMTVADHVIHDSMPHETEVMTPGDVLEHSSNVGATKVAKELGGKELYDYIRAFGFGKPTGVDLWGEDLGLVPAYKDWSGVSIGNIPFGQGFTVTPLQLVSGYATLVSGGRRVTP